MKQYFKKVYCFRYPRPGLKHWLSTFYKTSYQEALQEAITELSNIEQKPQILLCGISMGGWFALNAAQYINLRRSSFDCIKKAPSVNLLSLA